MINYRQQSYSRLGIFHIAGLVLFFTGNIISVASYGSVASGIVGLVFLLLGNLLVQTLLRKFAEEKAAFNICFGAFWFVASICAIMANQIDALQNKDSDAIMFYNLAVGDASAYSAKELRLLTEGSGAVVIWNFFYEGFKFFGFDPLEYIGIAVNCLTVALSCSASVLISRIIYEEDRTRMRRMIILSSLCGMYWLFAALHLRDSVVLLVTTVLILAYVWYLELSSVSRFCILVLSNIGCALILSELRSELVFVPLGTIVSASSALIICQERNASVLKRYILVAGILLPIAFGILFYSLSDIAESFKTNSDGYGGLTRDLSSADSLGVKYVANQPLPIRAVVGSIYLHLFPIPVWTGFSLGSAYHLLKSMNALFMYGVAALFIFSAGICFRNVSLRRPGILFVGGTAIGFTVAVALTSGETRHIGSFYPAILAFVLLPQIENPLVALRFRRYLLLIIVVMTMIHLVWLLLKL